MDASQLRSQISALQRECNQLERENQQMQNEINAICNSARAAATSLARSSNNAVRTLQESAGIIGFADQTMQTIAAEQDHIALLYQGFTNIETANKRIRELNNKIYFEFSNFRMVRKIVRAFVDNISLDMVKPELIYKSVEKEHLQSPDFWLSCAMLAIMHWKENDEAAAGRAIQQALSLDERQSILFFMSFNLLLGRKDAALKWFECYRKLDKTGDDANFLLLLFHATNLREDESDEFTKCIKAYLYEEYENSREMNDRAALVSLVRNHLIQCNAQGKPAVFNTLRNYVKDYSVMAQVLTMAKDNTAILDFVETTNSHSRGRGYVYIEKFISELLDTPDKKERAYTDEIKYNETVIKCVGDYALADEEFNKQKEHDTSALNLMSECVEWLFGEKSSQCSEVAKSNMFMLLRDIIEEACQQYFDAYRSKNKAVHPVVIKDYTTQMNFKNKNSEINKVASYYERKKEDQLATVKNTAMILSIVFAALCLVGGIVTIIMSIPALPYILFVAAVVLAIMAVVKNIGNKKKRAAIIANNDAAAEKAKQIVEKLFEEYNEYQAVYEEADRVSEDVLFAIKR